MLLAAALLWQHAAQLAAQTSLPAASVATTQPSRAQIDAWIDALRDDVYAVRQAAARQLLTAGAAALVPLAEATDSPDPEARAAARRLVALIDKAETNRRLAEFAADADGKQGLSLPGWEQYRKLVGGDASARVLFVEMQRQEAALLADVFDANRLTSKQSWEDRLLRLLRWPAMPADQPASPSLGTCATMLFLGSVAEAEPSDRSASYLYQLLQRPPVQPALVRAGRHDPLRRLVVGWVVDSPSRSASVIQQRLTLALALDMQEAVPLALDVALSNPAYLTVPSTVRAQALVLIAHLGGRSDVDRLEPLLEDATVCMAAGTVAQQFQPGQPPQPVQVRAKCKSATWRW